jgi:hypothetical protein
VIVVGQHWQSGPWRETPREIVIDSVVDGYDEVAFHFLDREQSSRCSTSAFLRTYVAVPS